MIRYIVGIFCITGICIACSQSDTFIDNTSFELNNSTAKCISIVLDEARASSSKIIQSAKLTMISSVADCGCKSASLDYAIYNSPKLPEASPIKFGNIALLNINTFDFEVNANSDETIIDNFVIEVGCSTPL